jgi:diguanylate cyclase (GGDEF)-like protein
VIAHEIGPLVAAGLFGIVALGAVAVAVRLKTRLAATSMDLCLRLEHAEAAAREARTWATLAADIANVGHWRIGVPDHAVFLSNQVFQIFGLSAAGDPPDFPALVAAFHPDDRRMVWDSFDLAVTARADFAWEARLLRPDGETRHVRARGLPQCDAAGQMIGVFGVFQDVTGPRQVEEQLRLANEAAARNNHALQEMALVDGLTGLTNRRQFDLALETEIRRAGRSGAPLGLILIDIDYFKAYNDIYGHAAGDDCLSRIAGVVAGIPQRPGDLAARYDGDGLVLLLPGTGEAGTEALAARTAAAVRALDIPHKGAFGPVTISCGVAVYNPAEGTPSPAALVQRADRALYRAKHTGRNRVCQDPAERKVTATPRQDPVNADH